MLNTSTRALRFGTDGWRGVMADDFTFANVRRVAQATAEYWNSIVERASRPLAGGAETGETPVPLRTAIVGFDNRFLSEDFARVTSEVLAANGITALLPAEAVPTPAVSFAIRDRKLCGGVMITASHNPPRFNGFKLKGDFAGPADERLCRAVESFIDRSPVRCGGGRVETYDPRPAYLAAVRRLVDLRKIRAAKLRVVFDSMHGCGGRVLEQAVGGTTIRAERDVFFGGVNPEPIQKNLGALCKAVKAARAEVGLATDGDGDRLGMVDDKGRYVSVQLVFVLLLVHLLKNRQQRGEVVVKSVNSTMLVDRICRKFGLPVVEVPIGFKHACEMMRTRDVLMAGEESGSMGFQGHIPERDGILANLLLLEMLAMERKSVTQLLAEVQKEFGRSAYERVDLACPLEKRDRLMEKLRREPLKKLLDVPVVEVKTFDGVKCVARDDSWLMFRASGTEPVLRIYCESTNAGRVQQLLAFGRRLAMSV